MFLTIAHLQEEEEEEEEERRVHLRMSLIKQLNLLILLHPYPPGHLFF